MKATYKIEQPDDTEITIKITMTSQEWNELYLQLKSKWPSLGLSVVISEMLREVHKVHDTNEN